jgi:hypothetical protein
MEFTHKGIYLDDEMPDINTFRNTAMGTRTSPLIDVSAAFDVIGEIKSGMVGWFSRPIVGTEVEILTSMNDGANWDKMNNGQYIQNAKELNDNPYIKLKYVIRSYVSQVREEDTPKVFIVILILSDKERNYWAVKSEGKLEWNDKDEVQLEMNKFEDIQLG